MNKKLALAIYVIMITSGLTFQKTNAQWVNFGTGFGNTYNQTSQPNNEESIGIGDFNGNPFNIPLSALHINTNFFNTYGTPPSYPLGEVFRTDAPNGAATFWRMQRGGTQFGMLYNNNDNNFRLEATQQDFLLFAPGGLGVSGANVPAMTQRIRVTSDIGLSLAMANLNNVTKTVMERGGGEALMRWPRAMLNIGTDQWIALQGQGGWRPWMDVGIFNIYGTDNMYLGLKGETFAGQPFWNDRFDAVISWGDNDALQGGGGFGPDNLRFIYTTTNNLDGSNEALPDGIEVARIDPHGYFGIGNFTQPFAGAGSGIQPARRLEIYDQSFNPFHTPLPAPQLRLTRLPALANTVPLPNNILNTGTWTDFQSNLNPPGVTAPFIPTGIANLYIHPSSDNATAGTPVNGRVGINIAQAGNTLEINAIGNQFGDEIPPVAPTTQSGLRFNDMRANISVPLVTNPWTAPNPHCVLTVDGNGDVVLVRDDGSGDVTACNTLAAADLDFVPKWNNIPSHQLCRSQIYDDGTTVSIGSYPPVTPGNNLYYQFEVTGSSVFCMQPNTGSGFTFGNTIQYPLMVKTDHDNVGPTPNPFCGLAILSAEPNVAGAALDRLHIYADDVGLTHFVSQGNNTVFRDKTTNAGSLGFIPALHTTVIKDDFETNQTGGPISATLYVEDQYTNIGIIPNAIYGNNNIDDHFISTTGAELVGVRGECSTHHTYPYTDHTGGLFLAYDATGANRGAHIEAIGAHPDQSRSNYGAYIWTGATSDGLSAAGYSQYNYGVYSRVFYQAADAYSAWGNYGGYFKAEDGLNNFGVYAETINQATNNIAGRFIASRGTKINYAVWATSTNNNCPGTCTQAAGFFNGDLVYTGFFGFASDSILKDNLTVVTELDTSVNSIHTYSFNYDTANYSSMNLSGGSHYGFIAEEVEQVFPNMVKQYKQPAEYDSLGNITSPEVSFKTVNYVEFIPLLWNGFKTLQQQMDSVKETIASCCAMAGVINPRSSSPNTNTGSIELENLKSILLDQNDPNPFNENTMIRWSVPTDFKEAVLLFYDNSGNQINKYKIDQKGNGELQVFGSKLSSGIYTYSLIVDGKLVDSKKMMKSK